jgi:NAD(P)-dependent dehydrogenase (short-subunit alcohol dehydrogenase family)
MPPMTESGSRLNGTTCLITGATSGIGRVTAEALAVQGAEVVIVGRDPSRCEATAAAIRATSGNPAVGSLVADLSSQAEVRRLADEVRTRFPGLRVLVNNAGALFPDHRETVDGIERTLALNHLAYFLLTDLLRETLVRNAPARVVSVASEAHRWAGRFDFDDPEGRVRYRPIRAYGQSKLANILFTSELSRQLAGTGVTANALHPGFVATNFAGFAGPIGWTFRRLSSLFATTPERGAQTSIHLASSPEVEGLSGRYFIDRREARPSPAACNEEDARRLWDLSLRWVAGSASVTPAPSP